MKKRTVMELVNEMMESNTSIEVILDEEGQKSSLCVTEKCYVIPLDYIVEKHGTDFADYFITELDLAKNSYTFMVWDYDNDRWFNDTENVVNYLHSNCESWIDFLCGGYKYE